MTFDLQDTQQEYVEHRMDDEGADERETGLRLNVLIEDPESIAALAGYPEGRERRGCNKKARKLKGFAGIFFSWEARFTGQCVEGQDIL